VSGNERVGLYGSVFISTLGWGLYTYFVPVFALHLGATFVELAYIGTAFSLAYAVAPIFVGGLADRVNRKHLYVLAIFINFVAAIALAFSSSVNEIIVIRALAGLGLAFFWPITEVLALQLAQGHSRVREMGLYSVSWGSAYLIGPALGGIIIQNLGFRDLFVISSVLMIGALSVGVSLRFDYSPRQEKKRFFEGQFHVMRELLPWYFMIACYGVAFSIVSTMFPGYASSIGITAESIGVLFTAFGTVRVLVYASEHYVHFGEKKALVSAAFLISVGSGIIVLFPNFSAFLIAIVILGGCFAIMYPFTISLVSRHFSDAQTGAAVGSYESVYGIGSAIGPMIAGALATVSNPRMSFVSVSFFAVLMMIIAAFARTFSND
jgi:MFS family permease